MTKGTKAIIFWTILVTLVISGVSYLVFKVASGFVSSFDGNNRTANFTHITGNYYLSDREKTICIIHDDFSQTVIKNIDSLNWNSQVIAGYRDGKYFLIDLVTDELKESSVKSELLHSLAFPLQTFPGIPGMR